MKKALLPLSPNWLDQFLFWSAVAVLAERVPREQASGAGGRESFWIDLNQCRRGDGDNDRRRHGRPTSAPASEIATDASSATDPGA